MIARVRRWGRHARGFRQLDAASKLLACEAGAMLTVARILVRALPFHRIARRLATDGRTGTPSAHDAADVARMVRMVAGAMPFRAMCLEQAVAAAAMLRRRGIAATIHLGTARDAAGAGFEAHAWLSVSGVVIVGGPVDRYTELARF